MIKRLVLALLVVALARWYFDISVLDYLRATLLPLLLPLCEFAHVSCY